jgi:Tol biopolymer transport system component
MVFYSNRFGDQYVLCTMKSDGSEQRMVPGTWSFRAYGRDPLISRDQRRIVFAQGDGERSWAMSVNPDGSELDTLVIDTQYSYVYLGDWSPDGTKLIFRLISFIRPSEGGVLVINPDGSGKLRLDEGYDPRFCGNDKVVYSGYDGSIFIIGTDGQGKRQLQPQLFGSSVSTPAGSPDGKKVAFCRALVVPPATQTCWLEIMGPDGSGHTQLAEIKGVHSFGEIEFSSDSKRVLFLAVGETSAEIYTINVDGSGLRALTGKSAMGECARWSPDGSRIVFTSTKDGNQEIYTVNADGPPILRRLTYDPANDYNPDW